MKKTLSVLLASVLSISGAIAQTDDNDNVKDDRPEPYIGHEVSLGHGLAPIQQLFAGTLKYVDYKNTTATGAISLGYRYHATRVISIGLTMAFEHESGQWKTHEGLIFTSLFGQSDVAYGRFSRTCFSFVPEIGFNYGESSNGMVSFYSFLAIGMTRRSQTATLDGNGSGNYTLYTVGDAPRINDIRTTFQVTPFGLRVGRALGGFAEIGLGYKGLFNYGLTYRF